MIDLNRKYQSGDIFRKSDGVSARIPANWKNSTIGYFIERGLYLYVAPTYDSETQKFDGYVLQNGGITKTVINRTAEDIAARAARQLQSDLQQATIDSAKLIVEVFAQLNTAGVLDVSALSDEAKEQFATLTALVDSYTP